MHDYDAGVAADQNEQQLQQYRRAWSSRLWRLVMPGAYAVADAPVSQGVDTVAVCPIEQLT